MMNPEMRQAALQSINAQLYQLIIDPPRKGNASHGKWVDLSQLQDKLDAIRPFWDAYVAVSQVEKSGSYALRDMMTEERDKYSSCKWWLTVLEAAIGQAKE